MKVPHYNSYRAYIKKRFGKPVLKMPLNGGFSCPNRDGNLSTKGCSFCDNRSFSPAAEKSASPLEQLNLAINRFSSRFSAFMPYLQPYSNTYGTVDQLRFVYEPLISVPNVVGIAIGTRPDCFNDSIFDYLKDISRRTYLSVELGLQSVHNSTLEATNRGHTFEDFCRTTVRLAEYGIETVAHVMLGLPGETPCMMMETARKISRLPVTGVKIHQLMIIRDTELESAYLEKKIETLTLEYYTELLCEFITLLHPQQHIHRLMADSKVAFGLIAPLWSEQKSEALSFINSYMDSKNIRQGSACRAD